MSKHYEKKVNNDCFYTNDTNVDIIRIKDIFNRLRKADIQNLNEVNNEDPYEHYMNSGNEEYIKRVRDMFKKYNKMDNPTSIFMILYLIK
jgi:hypothetical protein